MATLKKIYDFHPVSSNEDAKKWMEENSKYDIIAIYPWGGKLVIWFTYLEEIKTPTV